MWKLAGQAFLVLVIIGLIITFYYFIINKVKDALGLNQKNRKKNTKSAKSTTKMNIKPKSTNKKTASKKLKNPTDIQLLTAGFDELEGTDFERLVAMYYEEKGYKPYIVGGSGDHEVDIILTDPKENYKIAVQCKCWNTKNVGNDIILRLYAGKKVHKCLDAWCITTSDYTAAAKEAAENSNIRIFNGLYVQETIGKWRKKKAESLKLVKN